MVVERLEVVDVDVGQGQRLGRLTRVASSAVIPVAGEPG